MTKKEQQLLGAVRTAIITARSSVSDLSQFTDVQDVNFTYGVAGLNVAAKRLDLFLKSRDVLPPQTQPTYPESTYP